jgi:hypothetical protein
MAWRWAGSRADPRSAPLTTAVLANMAARGDDGRDSGGSEAAFSAAAVGAPACVCVCVRARARQA